MLAQMVQFGYIKPHTVSLMAKHKTDHPDLLSSTTLRYIRDATTKAHLNQSSTATRLMPWESETNLNIKSLEYDPEELPEEEDEEDLQNLDQFNFSNNENDMMMMPV